MSGILLVIALLLLTFSSGFFSASETALFSLSSMKVKSYQKSDQAHHRLIAKLVMNPSDLLVTILMLNVTVNILVQNVSANIFHHSSNWALTVGVPLGLTLIFGEIIPKSVAIQNNTRIAKIVAPFIAFFQKALGPLRMVITYTTIILSKILFFFLRREDEISPEELKVVLKSSQKHGVLHEDEIDLVQGYLNLQTATIKELMRPREEVVFFDINGEIDTLLKMFVDEECSRIPVCDDSLDKMIGIISAKDYFLHRDRIKNPNDLKRYITRPYFVPETTSGRKLLKQFQEEGRVTGVVVDEYGQVTGIISREDLVETVVGEIADMRDKVKKYTEAGENVIIASGKMELTELEDLFGVPFKSEAKMVTLGGWLTEKLGDIPKNGVNFATKDFFFHVLSSDPNRVKRVYIRKLN